MFVFSSNTWKSSILSHPLVGHAFSTRLGGVSKPSHLATMNTGFGRGEEDEAVCQNISRLCSYAQISDSVVGTPQIHSAEIRTVGAENCGEGITREVPYPCDGFVTEEAEVSLIVRVADCTPVLLLGIRSDGSPVVGAVHAGWRGTAKGIAPKAAELLYKMGAEKILAAIGPCIGSCCYNVGEDMRDEVASFLGREITDRYIKARSGVLFADIGGMNAELLREAGVSEIDILSECTACKPYLYHSHRATKGVRGTMAAVIGINQKKLPQ